MAEDDTNSDEYLSSSEISGNDSDYNINHVPAEYAPCRRSTRENRGVLRERYVAMMVKEMPEPTTVNEALSKPDKYM